MNRHMSKLTLERGVAYRRRWKRDAVQMEGQQWTFDGKPLALTLQEARSSLPKEGRQITADLYYSVLQARKDFYGEAGRDALRFLLGEEVWKDLPGRVPLLIGQCLHVECGVITGIIERQEDVVTWGHFKAHLPGPEGSGYLFPSALTYTFDREQHDSVLREAQARI